MELLQGGTYRAAPAAPGCPHVDYDRDGRLLGNLGESLIACSGDPLAPDQVR